MTTGIESDRTDRSTVEASVLSAADSLIAAFGRHDTEQYFAAFSPDASFVFYTHPQRLASVLEYRDVWRQWERDSGFHVVRCESSNRRVDVYGTSAVFSHDVVTTIENTDDGSQPVQTVTSERETIVFADVDGRWLAVHEHLSGR